MLSQPDGSSIVNIRSVHAPRIASYAASKEAIAALTATLAVEWADCCIRVNAIAAGYFPTDLESGAPGQQMGAGHPAATARAHRQGGRARPSGRVLLSDESAYVTGTAISADGDWRA